MTLGLLGGTRTPFALTYVGGGISPVTSGSTTQTSTRSIGTAASDRTLIIGMGLYTGNTNASEIVSLTVGGVATTRIVSLSGSDGARTWSGAFFVVPYATGTSASMVATFSNGSADRILNFRTYAAYGMLSSTPTATDSFAYTTGTATRSISVQGGGRVIGFASGIVNLSAATWTGITEDAEASYSTSASGGFATAQTASVSFAWGGSDSSLVLASFA
jgi:hypothetical protein